MRSAQLKQGDVVKTSDNIWGQVHVVNTGRSELQIKILNRPGFKTLPCREVVQRWRASKSRS